MNTDTDLNNIMDVNMQIDLDIQDDISCCVCFKEVHSNNISTLTDIAVEDITVDTIIKSACNKHYICIKCLHTIVTDYTNHPINEHNSHVYCPYPFEDCLTPAGTKNIFEHQTILKILDNFEQQQFMFHADRFAFPGYTITTCPCTYYVANSLEEVCNYPLLIENELISTANPGDLVVQCHQNEKCCKTFCYHCRTEVSRYERECRICKLTCENANPNIFNRYIVKETSFENVIYNDEEFESSKYFDENEYLYYNREITLEIALEHVTKLIEYETFCICPICKIHLYKTEKCNGLRHHNIERCYACGRIGTKTGGIHHNHWNPQGINGCFRFDYDQYVHTYIPEYRCNPNCQSHENGDCQREDHQLGISKLNKIRKKAIIYHFIKSLLPNIRYDLVDIIHDKYLNTPTAYELLPYKQTFLFLEDYREIMLDYSEETLYDHLNIQHPQTIHEFTNKSLIIDTQTYMHNYILPPQPEPIIELPISPPPIPPPRRPPPPPPPRVMVNNEIQQNLLELENIFNRMLTEEMQPLLGDIEQDITDILDSYAPNTNTNTNFDTNTNTNFETDTDTDTDTIYSQEIPEEISEEEIQGNDDITIYYNTSDIYIIGSDSDSDTDTEQEL